MEPERRLKRSRILELDNTSLNLNSTIWPHVTLTLGKLRALVPMRKAGWNTVPLLSGWQRPSVGLTKNPVRVCCGCLNDWRTPLVFTGWKFWKTGVFEGWAELQHHESPRLHDLWRCSLGHYADGNPLWPQHKVYIFCLASMYTRQSSVQFLYKSRWEYIFYTCFGALSRTVHHLG